MLGRSVVADALREADKSGALAAEREKNWRKGYPAHFRRLIEAGLPSREAAVVVAQDGLESLHRRMRVIDGDGTETGLDAVRSAPARSFPATVTVQGTGQPDRQLLVPYRGERLHGDALLRRLDAWAAAGVIEPSCAEAVRAVVAHPEWLPLPGQTVVVLGAGAEIGPLSTLLSWGARAIGVDLPGPAIWARVLDMAHRSGGTLEIPVADREAAQRSGASDDDSLAQNAGLDLAGDIPTAADWIASVDGPLVLGNYVYADGAANVRVSSAVDALTVRLQAARPDVTLAFLATPTDVFAVPDDAVEQSRRAFAARPPGGQDGQLAAPGPLRWPTAPPRLPDGCRAGHQRQPRGAAGAQLRAGQAAAALARHRRPAGRRHRLAERRPADAHPVGAEEPGPGGGVRGRAPLRRPGLRARHHQGADGGAARA